MHETTINEKRGHEFKIEQVVVYGRIYMDKREEENSVIIISKNKIILKKNDFYHCMSGQILVLTVEDD